MEIRIRLGSGIARFAPAPTLRIEVRDGATVGELCERLGSEHPELAPALVSALPIIGGEHVSRARSLAHGDEVALLAPVAGGCPNDSEGSS